MILFFSEKGWKTTTYLQNQDIMLEYTNDLKTKVIITIQCDKDTNFSIEFQEKLQENYKFLAKTKRVCMNSPFDCKIRDEKKIYDLTNLRVSNQDWIAYDTRLGMTKREYHISVCKPLSPLSSNHDCPDPKTSVCMTNNQESFTMGTMDPKLEVKIDDDNSLILTNDHGSSCNSKFNYSSQIIFRCNEIEHGPKYYDRYVYK